VGAADPRPARKRALRFLRLLALLKFLCEENFRICLCDDARQVVHSRALRVP